MQYLRKAYPPKIKRSVEIQNKNAMPGEGALFCFLFLILLLKSRVCVRCALLLPAGDRSCALLCDRSLRVQHALRLASKQCSQVNSLFVTAVCREAGR